MHANIPHLEKRAIRLALKENWVESIEVNSQILKEAPNNLKAKIRLGRAYLLTKKFKEAQKLFKEVLEVDPINKVAIKNLELAKNKSAIQNGSNGKHNRSLIKKPGTTKEIETVILAQNITADKLTSGEELTINVLKTQVKIIYKKKQIASLKDKSLVSKLNSVVKNGGEITGIFATGSGKKIKVLIESSEPIFKSEKQNIKPYLKKGSIKEHDIELGTPDETLEE